MSTDFTKPVVTDAYATLLPGVQAAISDLARGLDPTLTGTSTNVPTGTKRFNEATGWWERYNGTSWVLMSMTGNFGTLNVSGNYTGTNATSYSIDLTSGTRSIHLSTNSGDANYFMGAGAASYYGTTTNNAVINLVNGATASVLTTAGLAVTGVISNVSTSPNIFGRTSGGYVAVGDPRVVLFTAAGQETSLLTFQAGVASALCGFKANESDYYITNCYAGNALGSNGIKVATDGAVTAMNGLAVNGTLSASGDTTISGALKGLIFGNEGGNAYSIRPDVNDLIVRSNTGAVDAIKITYAGQLQALNGLAVTGTISSTGTISPKQATTAGAPAYLKGAIFFDTTLNKLQVGGASAWETVGNPVTYTTQTTPLLGSGVSYSASHSLGVVPSEAVLEIICLTTDQGYAVGDIIENPDVWNSTTASAVKAHWKNTTNVGRIIQSGHILGAANKSTGTFATLTAASWAYRFRLRAA